MVKMQPRPAVVRLAQKPSQEDRMPSIDYIGFDIHKKTISFCVKAPDGAILEEGTIPALRKKLLAWAKARQRPWMGAMEATLFTGWIYDLLKPLAQALKVAHPPMHLLGESGLPDFAAAVHGSEDRAIGDASD